MSENPDVPGRALTRVVISEMLMKNYEKLPNNDQKLFQYAPVYLGGNAAIAGLVSNSLYRRALNVRQAVITSAIPMSVLPFLTTVALYSAVVTNPLLSGDLNCPSCAFIRGALVGVVGGGLYPILLALPVNIGLAARYSSALFPEKGKALQFAVDISKPVMNQMKLVLLIQAFFGVYLSSRNFDAYTKLAHLTFGREERTD
ncbi:transmembrane protein 126A-like [Xyrichtys novacula]|uniref:Transmembrane protein 126A-like n=1 Tax=Xyrichtys novacula TaxID=13765 RepID=A0AAV1FDD0_XYRNO|nr:transmembrane protein 126A-like [Xyrichtys novacula]